MRRMTAMVTMVMVLVLATAQRADAKGPDEVSIHGGGLEAPIVLQGEEGGRDDLWTLVEQSGWFAAVFGQEPDPMLDAPPAGDLGPRFELEWRVPGGDGSADMVRQVLYPYASTGVLVYTEPGQVIFDGQRTVGGWFVAPGALLDLLQRNGLPSRAALDSPPTTVAPSPAGQVAEPRASHDSDRTPLLVGGLIVLGAAAAGTLVLVRIRPRRVTSVAPS